MQRLVIEDGKLVAYTDNGKFDKNGVSIDLSGDFLIDAKLAKSLISENHNLPLYAEVLRKGINKTYKWHYEEYLENIILINSDDVTSHIIHKQVEARKKSDTKYRNLVNAIEKFNKNRRFYEREFDLSGFFGHCSDEDLSE